MTIVSGTKRGPYEILAMLGAGGMGEVCSSFHFRGLPENIKSRMEADGLFAGTRRVSSSF
jgi:hypothetical protein